MTLQNESFGGDSYLHQKRQLVLFCGSHKRWLIIANVSVSVQTWVCYWLLRTGGPIAKAVGSKDVLHKDCSSLQKY